MKLTVYRTEDSRQLEEVEIPAASVVNTFARANRRKVQVAVILAYPPPAGYTSPLFSPMSAHVISEYIKRELREARREPCVD